MLQFTANSVINNDTFSKLILGYKVSQKWDKKQFYD